MWYALANSKKLVKSSTIRNSVKYRYRICQVSVEENDGVGVKAELRVGGRYWLHVNTDVGRLNITL